ncbi:unnamed protein product [Coffea canephora]|uniref:AIR9 PH-like domain-containing protein n=1 Tax=Coffea canephora TaxID=49390 RepID=A0A068UBQ9_COFCA|nr:unnamed protein product [Coffea canephora]
MVGPFLKLPPFSTLAEKIYHLQIIIIIIAPSLIVIVCQRHYEPYSYRVPTTEVRECYAPPFDLELFRNDQHRLKIVVDSENEVDLMVQTRHLRDVIVLVVRGLVQRFNSTSLNSLLKIDN